MGVRGLYTFLKKYAPIVSFQELSTIPNRKYGLDISQIIFKYKGDHTRIFEYIQMFENANQKILCVFDGKSEEYKQDEMERRNKMREEKAKDAQKIKDLLEKFSGDLSYQEKKVLEEKYKMYAQSGWQLTQDLRHGIKRLLYEKYIPLIKSTVEADSLLAQLSQKKYLDYVISGDMDLLALGASCLCIPYSTDDRFYVVHRTQLLSFLQLDDNSFRQLCAVCSTDVKKSGQPPSFQEALPYFQKYKNIETIRKKYPDYVQSWPSENHIFYRDYTNMDDLIIEEDKPRMECFEKNQPMPYLSSPPVLITQ
jgi:5'-3' exonuclease